MTKTVVILGGNFAGLTVAHKLLKGTLSAVKDLKVVLVNPSDHYFFNIATPRAILPERLDNNPLYVDIPSVFTYAGSAFSFILGKAEQVDPSAKTVTISTATGAITQSYDYLVVTTGSNTIGEVPWKANGLSYEGIKSSLAKVAKQIKAAKSIVIGGAGATGIEVAGELGFEYGKTKEITVITGGATILTGTMFNEGQLKMAVNELKKLNVKIVYNTKVTSYKTLPSGQTELTLSNGTTKAVDLYLPTVGLEKNTSFLPSTLLNSHGYVAVDDKLRSKSDPTIYAAGDVLDLERSGVMIAKTQATHVAKNLDSVLKGQQPVAYKIPAKDSMAVTLGRSKGIGSMGGTKIPSFVIWFVKGRNFMIGNAKGFADGSA